jgi:hypothetical protein
MEHSVLKISASPKQISKLRNGHKVRVKPAMEGKGVCVSVDPLKYNIISKTFSKGRGAELQLSPQELQMNKMGKGMCGGDIFGKIAEVVVDKMADKAIDKGIDMLQKESKGRGMIKGSEEIKKKMADLRARKGKKMTGGAFTNEDVRPVIKEVGQYLNPLALVELMSGGGLGDANPLLLGYDLGHNVIGPALYKSIYGHPRGYGFKPDAKQIQKLNEQLGTNMDYLKQAGLGDAVSNAMSSSLIREGVDKAKSLKEDIGMGLYAGSGLYASSAKGRAVTSQVSGSKVIPNFLESKPFFENNQLQYTLPVAYQKFHK